MRYPYAHFEIDTIERAAKTDPMIAAAAEAPYASTVQRGIVNASFSTLVKLLDLGVEIHSTAFEEATK